MTLNIAKNNESVRDVK